MQTNSVLDNKESKVEVSKNIIMSQDAWDCLKISYINMNREKSDVSHSDIISVLAAMHTNISDNSNLILDPDLDSYYLMDATMVRQLALADCLYK